MKVVVAAGGRFHALHLANQLEKRGALKKLFSFSYTKKDQNFISKELVCNYNFVKYLDFSFSKFHLNKFFYKSKFNIFKDNLFDFWLSKNIDQIQGSDIFVGWTNYFLKSLPQIRKTGAKVIAESGSCHIKYQAKLLAEEYDKWGLYYPAVRQENICKIVQEYEQADYIMTISDFVYKSFLKQGICKDKLLQVPCGVDVEFFLQKSREKEVESDGKFRVICVGLLCLRKGIQYLIQAWNKLNLPKNETELLLVGNLQDDFKKILKDIKIVKNVVFYGSVNKNCLAELYKKSSLFVLPSVEDGFGMVIGEAMASGLPVICTDHTAGVDLVEDGKHGFIISARDAEALSEKILWCYKNRQESKQMGKKGQERIKLFSWDNYGEKIFQIYKKILKGNNEN